MAEVSHYPPFWHHRSSKSSFLSFYEWRDPARTAITLLLLSIIWLGVTFIPLPLLLKITQLNAGIIFFGLFPIATRYPQYRLLASPLKWLLWKIPTDAEWAIARLQTEARHRMEAMPDRINELEKEKQSNEANIGRYHCTSGSHHGDLHISSTGAKYISAVRKNMMWEVSFEEVKILQKFGAGDGLLFVCTSGDEFRVAGLKARNEIFSQIIGYSGLRWQVMG